MRIVFTILVFLGSVVSANAQDFQLRVPFHFQIIGSENTEAKDRFGLAGWSVLPDVTPEGSRATNLSVAGLLWQHKKKNWVEFMAGSRTNQNGYIDPLANIRFSQNQIPKLNFSGDIMVFPRERNQRFLWWLSADTPVHLGKMLLRAGVESENINFRRKKDSWGIGPKVSVPIPIKFPGHLKVTIVTAYQFRNGKDFLRVYTLTSFQSAKVGS